MNDLVEQLRERAEYEGYPGSTLTLQAADEIERLRAQVEKLSEELIMESIDTTKRPTNER